MPPTSLTEWISPAYLKPHATTQLLARFNKNKPFPYLELRNFLTKSKAQQLLAAVKKEHFILKESDLFTFLQTADFISSDHSPLRDFRAFFSSSSFVSYITSLTGLPLAYERVDMSGTIYRDTHYLLCHDDQLEGRRLAYMYYLSDLKRSDGGRLHLYTQKKGAPSAVIKGILPRFNSLVLFEVSPFSFHDVGEVTSEKERIAISGWFYGRH